MIDDLAKLDRGPDQISIPGNVKNPEKMAEWPAIDDVYLSSATQKQFEKLAPLLDPVCLTLDMVKTDNFEALSNMKRLDKLVIDSNARITTLDFLVPLTGLRRLELRALKNTLDLQPLGQLTGLQSLILDGGFSRTMKAKSVAPLADLKNVVDMELVAIRFDDQSLAAVAEMSALETLRITNYFPTESYAELCALRPDIQCDRLAPYVRNKAVHHVMDENGKMIRLRDGGYFVTGRRKPFVKLEDAHLLQRYVDEWDGLVAKFRRK